jgi:hypothetical protein
MIVIFTIMFLLENKSYKEHVYRESFTWDTLWDGIKISSSTLYKIKGLPIYYIRHDPADWNTHPTSHSKYGEFLDKVKEIKYNPKTN